MAKPRSRRGDSSDSGSGASDGSSGVTPSRSRALGKETQGAVVEDTEEARIFRAAVRDVKPLPTPAHVPQGAAPPRPPRVRRRAPIVDFAPLDEGVPAGAPDADASSADAPGAADPLSFRRPGVRDRTLRQLRRGRYPVEDELDLHGLNQAAARDQLADFIAASSHAGLRCVRVVHGKGYRSGARGPVLKIAVNGWLKRHADVLAFTSARALDGGTGAVYVLLR